jgi:hypothetical protein
MKNYIVAMLNVEDHDEPKFLPLNTGKMYTRVEAMAKAEELNNTCKEELKVLDYDSFVAYSTYSE